ncbi:hypothetical protein ACJMK2_017216 [Sinanodonta woodiana]|uniref:Nitrogen permease regulator 2-like protein n=1 Tax=Sinanodonta woodiana TaxID=1069815 RepID=A0ABD3UW69_SINWO
MGTIKCILFSEFHPIAGPKITFQVPEDYISKETFDSIHNYIITKPELQTRLVTVNALGHKFVGCPVCIDNPKYDRNALIFNLCFVFDAQTQTCPYDLVIKKLASYVTQLELESGFLSNDETKSTLPKLLTDILVKLNENGCCSIVMGELCTIYLKVSPVIEDPNSVQDHDVPIFTSKKVEVGSPLWDITTQQVLQYIDGFNHVAKIATEADVEINLVKACLQNLLHYKVITIISIFQYSNVYTCTPNICRLANDPDLQEECIQFVATQGRVQPSFRDIFMFYSGLTPGTTVKALCNRSNPRALKIDEKKLIQFGLMKKLIRRLHKYPIKVPGDNDSSSKIQHLTRWLNGMYSYDEICCKTGLSYQDLEDRLDNIQDVIVCWK